MSNFIGVYIGLKVTILHFISPATAYKLPYDVQPRTVGRCGSDFGGLLCNSTAGDPCCSKYGFCGHTTDFCLTFYGCQSGCTSSGNTSNASTATWASLPSGAQTGIISAGSVVVLCLIILGLGSCWKSERKRRIEDLLHGVESGGRKTFSRTQHPTESVANDGSLSEDATMDEQNNAVQYSPPLIALHREGGERQEESNVESEPLSREGPYVEIPEITIKDVDNTQEGRPDLALDVPCSDQTRNSTIEIEINNSIQGITQWQNGDNPNLSVEEAFNLLDQALIITQLEDARMIDDSSSTVNGENRGITAEGTIIAIEGVVDAANVNPLTTLVQNRVEQTNDIINENSFQNNHEVSLDGEDTITQHPENYIILGKGALDTRPGQIIARAEIALPAQLRNLAKAAEVAVEQQHDALIEASSHSLVESEMPSIKGGRGHVEWRSPFTVQNNRRRMEGGFAGAVEVESKEISGERKGTALNEQPGMKAESLSSKGVESYGALPNPEATIIGHAENNNSKAVRRAGTQGNWQPDHYTEKNRNDSLKVQPRTHIDEVTPTSVEGLNHMSLKELRRRPQVTATDRLRELWLQKPTAADDANENRLCVRCSQWRPYQLRICNHRPSLCRVCIATAVHDSIGWPEVRCPDADCGAHLRPNAVGRFVTEREYKQWINRRRELGLTAPPKRVNEPIPIAQTRRIEELPAKELRPRRILRDTELSRHCLRCLGAKFQQKITPECSHNSSLCHDCIAVAIHDRLGWPEIRCPEPTCRAHLRSENVREFIEKDDYEVWMERRQDPRYTTSRISTRMPIANIRAKRLEDPKTREQALQGMFNSVDSSRQCSRCLTMMRSRRIPSKPLTVKCNHDSTLCRYCLGRAIQDSLGSAEVRCPEPNCGAHLDPKDVRSWVSDSKYRMWIDGRRNKVSRGKVLAFEQAKVLKSICQICFEEKLAAAEFPQRKVTEKCNNHALACSECVSRTIKAAIESGSWANILCPLCPNRLGPKDIAEFAAAEDLERYNRLDLQRMMEGVPNFRWCMREGCLSGQIHDEGEKYPRMICNECSYSMCYTHYRPWHQGLSCRQYDKQNEIRASREEKATEEKIRKITKPCPKCGTKIEKVADTCSHMTCRPPKGCGHEFCYDCFAPWTGYGRSTRHKDGCIIGS